MGLDGGGPPPTETGATPVQKAESHVAPKIEARTINPETAARKQYAIRVLSDPRLAVFKEDEIVGTQYQNWVEGLRSGIEPAVDLAIAAGLPDAIVEQPYEAATDLSTPDGRFGDLFFSAFEAHATIGNNIENISPHNITEIINNPDIKRIAQEKEGEIPQTEGTVVVIDSAGKPLYLIAETGTDGVRLIIKGNEVLIPGHPASGIKPELLIKTDENISSASPEDETEENLMAMVQKMKDERLAEVSQMSDTDLNNKMTEFQTSIEQLVTDPEQKKFFTDLVEGLKNKDRAEITPEQLQLIEMAIGKSSTDPKERKRLRGLLGILLVFAGGALKDFAGGTGLTRMPQSRG